MEVIDLFAFLPLLMLAIGIKPILGINCRNEAYLSAKTGKSLRGFFAVIVVLHHLSLQMNVGTLFKGCSFVGYLCVSVYFFLSGYGLQKSHMASEKYRKNFLQKRMSKILLPYAIVNVVYWLGRLMTGQVYGVQELIISLREGKTLVSNSWYIICICCFYFAYWIFMQMCKYNHKKMILCTCLWFVGYSVVCSLLGYNRWWYNTAHLLIVGVFWACYEAKLLDMITKKYWAILLVTTVLLGATMLGKAIITVQPYSLFLSMVSALFFVIFVLLLSLKVRVGNRILDFLGGISLELYLIHGLWIIVSRSDVWYVQNDALWVMVVLFGSLVSALLLHKVNVGLFKWMDNSKKDRAVHTHS